MKLTMLIKGLQHGQSPAAKREGAYVTYTAVWGDDNHNRYARAVLYEGAAVAFAEKIASILGEGEVVQTKRIVAVFEGEWKTEPGKKEGDAPRRSFNARTFDILDGMELENARLMLDAQVALKRAEALRASGNLAQAYEQVAQFTANFAGVPLDLDAFLADAAENDAQFGVVDRSSDPEAFAAAHFAREDRVQNVEHAKPAPAAPEQAAAAAASSDEGDVPAPAELEQPMDFGSETPISEDVAEEKVPDFGSDEQVHEAVEPEVEDFASDETELTAPATAASEEMEEMRLAGEDDSIYVGEEPAVSEDEASFVEERAEDSFDAQADEPAVEDQLEPEQDDVLDDAPEAAPVMQEPRSANPFTARKPGFGSSPFNRPSGPSFNKPAATPAPVRHEQAAPASKPFVKKEVGESAAPQPMARKPFASTPNFGGRR